MKSILFIEDDAAERFVVGYLLRQCAKAFHGEVAFEAVSSWPLGVKFVEEHAPDVVIADLALPPQNSDETIEQLKLVIPRWPPVVVATGNDSREEELRVKCLVYAGAADFMLKTWVNHHAETFYERIYHAHLRRAFANGTAS